MIGRTPDLLVGTTLAKARRASLESTMSLAAIRSILVPTDFSDDAATAFAHALKLAVALRADLDVFHVEPKNDQSDWHWAPGVVATLVQWGVLPKGSTEADLESVGIRLRRGMAGGLSPEAAILQETASAHADLVVMSTHGRAGLERWLQPSVAFPVALKGVVPVLLFPAGSKGFVDKPTGEASLHNLLLPVDHRPSPLPGFDAAKLLTRALPQDRVKVTTLHVGTTQPEMDLLAPDDNWSVQHLLGDGAVVDEIVAASLDRNVDLIIAVTEGRRGFLDALRGSTVERLLDRSHIPVLIVPQQDA
jgi:nucleotide-binding universal stress UspA family protein